MRTVAICTAALAALALSPIPTEATNVASRVAYALKIAKRADARSRQALAAARIPGPQGERGERGQDGANGAQGAAGSPGAAGVDGTDGAKGATGAEGPTGPRGPQGEQGPPGPSGTASLSVASATTPDIVPVGIEPTTVVMVRVAREVAGLAYVVADAQFNGENGTGDTVTCELRVDASTVAARTSSVPGGTFNPLSASAALELGPGEHTAALSCRKGSGISQVEVSAERARISVIGG